MLKLNYRSRKHLLLLCAFCAAAVLAGALLGCAGANQNEELLTAAANGDVITVERLANAGADINYVGKTGNRFTALLWACFRGKWDVATFLLNHGADPNIKSATGYQALFYAVGETEANARIVRLLLEKGADPAPLLQYSQTEKVHPEIKELIRTYKARSPEAK